MCNTLYPVQLAESDVLSGNYSGSIPNYRQEFIPRAGRFIYVTRV